MSQGRIILCNLCKNDCKFNLEFLGETVDTDTGELNDICNKYEGQE